MYTKKILGIIAVLIYSLTAKQSIYAQFRGDGEKGTEIAALRSNSPARYVKPQVSVKILQNGKVIYQNLISTGSNNLLPPLPSGNYTLITTDSRGQTNYEYLIIK